MASAGDSRLLSFLEGLDISFHRTTRVPDHEDPDRQTVFEANDIGRSSRYELTPWPLDGDGDSYLLALDCVPGLALNRLEAFCIRASTERLARTGVKLEIKVEGQNIAVPHDSHGAQGQPCHHPPSRGSYNSLTERFMEQKSFTEQRRQRQSYFFLPNPGARTNVEWVDGIAVKEEPRLVRQFVVRNNGKGASLQHQVTGEVDPDKMGIVQIEATFAPCTPEPRNSLFPNSDGSSLDGVDWRPAEAHASDPKPSGNDTHLGTVQAEPTSTACPPEQPSPRSPVSGLPVAPPDGTDSGADEGHTSIPYPRDTQSAFAQFDLTCVPRPPESPMLSPLGLDIPSPDLRGDGPANGHTPISDPGATQCQPPPSVCRLHVLVHKGFDVDGRTTTYMPSFSLPNIAFTAPVWYLKNQIEDKIHEFLGGGHGDDYMLSCPDPFSLRLSFKSVDLDYYQTLEFYDMQDGDTVDVFEPMEDKDPMAIEDSPSSSSADWDMEDAKMSVSVPLINSWGWTKDDFDISYGHGFVREPCLSSSGKKATLFPGDDAVNSARKWRPRYSVKKLGGVPRPPPPPLRLQRELEVVPGGLIRQPLLKDPGVISWDSRPKTTFTIRIVNFEQFRTITGREPPAPPELPPNTGVSRRTTRNPSGTDGFLISNAEYMSKHPLNEVNYMCVTATTSSDTSKEEKPGSSRREAGAAEALRSVRRWDKVKVLARSTLGGELGKRKRRE